MIYTLLPSPDAHFTMTLGEVGPRRLLSGGGKPSQILYGNIWRPGSILFLRCSAEAVRICRVTSTKPVDIM